MVVVLFYSSESELTLFVGTIIKELPEFDIPPPGAFSHGLPH